MWPCVYRWICMWVVVYNLKCHKIKSSYLIFSFTLCLNNVYIKDCGIYKMLNLVWFHLVLWHINYCRLFN